MTISSRTPDGSPNVCPVCGNPFCIEASMPPGDAPCPHCGSLVWFAGDPSVIIADAQAILGLNNQLYRLIDEAGHRKIILDFSNVEHLSSPRLGSLITIDKKVKSVNGKLRLCSLRPELYELLAATRLNKLFDIHIDQKQALESL